MLGMYVCLPALIAALLFRGGLILRMAGMTFVRRDGAAGLPLARVLAHPRGVESVIGIGWSLVGPTMNGPGYTVLEAVPLLLALYCGLDNPLRCSCQPAACRTASPEPGPCRDRIIQGRYETLA